MPPGSWICAAQSRFIHSQTRLTGRSDRVPLSLCRTRIMSRIGRKPVPVPANVKIALADSTISVEGPKGKLSFTYKPAITVEHDEAGKQLVVSRADDERESRALHGLTRSLIANMVQGVVAGYTK